MAWNWHHFHPFCELVDCHEQVLMSSHRLWYLADDVQPPDRKRPGDWHWLQRLSWLVHILGVVLAGFAGLDQVLRIMKYRWPVEPLAENFPAKDLDAT